MLHRRAAMPGKRRPLRAVLRFLQLRSERFRRRVAGWHDDGRAAVATKLRLGRRIATFALVATVRICLRFCLRFLLAVSTIASNQLIEKIMSMLQSKK